MGKKSKKEAPPPPEPELTPKQLKQKKREEAQARAAENRKIVTAGTTAWTGKLPAQLLHDTCQKNKWTAADFQIRGTGESLTAVVYLGKKHPKTQAVTKVRLDPPPNLPSQKTPLEARHYAATYALHRIMSTTNLKMMLPPAHRDFWVELDGLKAEAPKHDKWKWDSDPFSAYEQHQKEKAEFYTQLKERQTKSEHKNAITAVKSSIKSEAGEEAKRIRFSSTLNMSKELRARVEQLLQTRNGFRFSKAINLDPGHREKIVTAVAKLGFPNFQVAEALEYTSSTSDCLTWLLVHVPEGDLPKLFMPQHLDNSIRVASSLSVEGATFRIKEFGFSEQVALRAVKNTGSLAEAMAALTNDLAGASIASTEGALDFWDEEIESIKGMYENVQVFTNGCSWKLANGLSVFFYRPASYPDTCPGIGLEFNAPKYVLLDAIQRAATYGQEFVGDYMLLGIAQWLEDEFEAIVKKPCKLAKLSAAITGVKQEPRQLDAKKQPRAKRPRVALDSSKLRQVHDQRFATNEGAEMLGARQSLPAWKKQAEIIDLVENNSVILVTGETGSGKSTQVVQFILDHAIQGNSGGKVNIVCTQPRRISAIGVAQRVAAERLCDVGNQVGYTIRGEAKTSADTQINFVTTGVLLRMMQSDAEAVVQSISHIVVDEVHERSIDSDFLLILLKRVLAKNSKLKVILMSATVDPKQFVDYFKPVSKNVGYTHIEGRTFPVDKLYLNDIIAATEYVPANLASEGVTAADVGQIVLSMKDGIDYSLVAATVNYIHSKLGKKDGSILVFMSGAAEIDRTITRINQASQHSDFWCLPLHAALPPAEQRLVFKNAPHGKRKVVVSTNVAETSITISDIVAVIDSGRVKEMTFDATSNVARLVDGWASRAAVTQRMGRAGRVRAGTCYKLYTASIEQDKMEARPPPEMLRCSLDSLYLNVKSLGIENVPKFLGGALDPPPEISLQAAMGNLQNYGAIDSQGKLTPLGKHISLLPTDPQCAKLLILSASFGCLRRGLTIAALIGGKPPVVAPKEKRDEAKAAFKKFAKADGDLLGYARVFDEWSSMSKSVSSAQLRRWCQDNFISHQACRDIQSSKRQLLGNLMQIGLVDTDKEDKLKEELTFNDSKDIVVCAVIGASMSPQIVEAVYPKKEYISTASGSIEAPRQSQRYLLLTPKSERVFLHPGSSLFGENNLSPYVSFGTSVVTAKHFIAQTAPLSIYGLLFFANSIKVDILGNGVVVDNWTGLQCWPRIGILGQFLKMLFDELMEKKFEIPTLSFHDDPIVTCVLDLIEADGRN